MPKGKIENSCVEAKPILKFSHGLLFPTLALFLFARLGVLGDARSVRPISLLEAAIFKGLSRYKASSARKLALALQPFPSLARSQWTDGRLALLPKNWLSLKLERGRCQS